MQVFLNIMTMEVFIINNRNQNYAKESAASLQKCSDIYEEIRKERDYIRNKMPEIVSKQLSTVDAKYEDTEDVLDLLAIIFDSMSEAIQSLNSEEKSNYFVARVLDLLDFAAAKTDEIEFLQEIINIYHTYEQYKALYSLSEKQSGIDNLEFVKFCENDKKLSKFLPSDMKASYPFMLLKDEFEDLTQMRKVDFNNTIKIDAKYVDIIENVYLTLREIRKDELLINLNQEEVIKFLVEQKTEDEKYKTFVDFKLHTLVNAHHGTDIEPGTLESKEKRISEEIVPELEEKLFHDRFPRGILGPVEQTCALFLTFPELTKEYFTKVFELVKPKVAPSLMNVLNFEKIMEAMKFYKATSWLFHFDKIKNSLEHLVDNRVIKRQAKSLQNILNLYKDDPVISYELIDYIATNYFRLYPCIPDSLKGQYEALNERIQDNNTDIIDVLLNKYNVLSEMNDECNINREVASRKIEKHQTLSEIIDDAQEKLQKINDDKEKQKVHTKSCEELEI